MGGKGVAAGRAGERALLARIMRALEARRDALVCAYLFGSVARGDAGPLSDVDLALLFESGVDSDRRINLAAALASSVQELAGPGVDITILNDAPPALAHRVLREGRLLLTRDERGRVAFETKVIREYLDFQPVLASYDRELLKRAREGRLGT
jgi:hypothetical protein